MANIAPTILPVYRTSIKTGKTEIITPPSTITYNTPAKTFTTSITNDRTGKVETRSFIPVNEAMKKIEPITIAQITQAGPPRERVFEVIKTPTTTAGEENYNISNAFSMNEGGYSLLGSARERSEELGIATATILGKAYAEGKISKYEFDSKMMQLSAVTGISVILLRTAEIGESAVRAAIEIAGRYMRNPLGEIIYAPIDIWNIPGNILNLVLNTGIRTVTDEEYREATRRGTEGNDGLVDLGVPISREGYGSVYGKYINDESGGNKVIGRGLYNLGNYIDENISEWRPRSILTAENMDPVERFLTGVPEVWATQHILANAPGIKQITGIDDFWATGIRKVGDLVKIGAKGVDIRTDTNKIEASAKRGKIGTKVKGTDLTQTYKMIDGKNVLEGKLKNKIEKLYGYEPEKYEKETNLDLLRELEEQKRRKMIAREFMKRKGDKVIHESAESIAKRALGKISGLTKEIEIQRRIIDGLKNLYEDDFGKTEAEKWRKALEIIYKKEGELGRANELYKEAKNRANYKRIYGEMGRKAATRGILIPNIKEITDDIKENDIIRRSKKIIEEGGKEDYLHGKDGDEVNEYIREERAKARAEITREINRETDILKTRKIKLEVKGKARTKEKTAEESESDFEFTTSIDKDEGDGEEDDDDDGGEDPSIRPPPPEKDPEIKPIEVKEEIKTKPKVKEIIEDERRLKQGFRPIIRVGNTDYEVKETYKTEEEALDRGAEIVDKTKAELLKKETKKVLTEEKNILRNKNFTKWNKFKDNKKGYYKEKEKYRLDTATERRGAGFNWMAEL